MQEALRSARAQSALMMKLRDDEFRRALGHEEMLGEAGCASPHALLGLWSTHRFPGRNSQPTAFAQGALAALSDGQASEFSEVTDEDDGQMLHYAIPLRMESGCIACHNARPDSPKRDWQAGEIAGIQVVELPVPHRTGMRAQDLALLLLIAASGLASIISLLIQGHRAKLAGEDLVRKNQELEVLKDRADEASRTKTRFLSNMRHEICTPLNAIIGTLQIIDPVSLTRESRDSFDIIRRSSLSLLDIVNGILDISKIEADEATISKRQFELRPFISDVLTQHGMQATEKKIEFLVRFDPLIPRRVFTDPGKIEQILNNLLSNAIKFTDNGSVMLSANRLSPAVPAANPDYPEGWSSAYRIPELALAMPISRASFSPSSRSTDH